MVWPCYVTLHGEQGGVGGSPISSSTRHKNLPLSSSSYFPIVDEITLLLERTSGGTDAAPNWATRERNRIRFFCQFACSRVHLHDRSGFFIYNGDYKIEDNEVVSSFSYLESTMR